MQKNTYHYSFDGKKYHLRFYWEFSNGVIGERFVILCNVNALIFMVDMLEKLGYNEVQ